MKKIIFSCLTCFITTIVSGQAVTYLAENFDVACAVATEPGHWLEFNPLPGTAPMGEWVCTPTNGRPASTSAQTPGMMCTSVYGSPMAYNLDTSYLITPMLNISSYAPGKIYLRFDSKVSNINLGGRLSVIESYDSSFHFISDTDITGASLPLIGSGDSSAWVTHEIEITRFEVVGNFYIGFRYTGTTTTGSIWYLDNVNTSRYSLHTENVQTSYLPLTVVGQSSPDQITIAYSTPHALYYQLGVYDMMGREVYKETLNAAGGFENYTISGLHLRPGMYCIKMGNDSNYGFAKTIVQ